MSHDAGVCTQGPTAKYRDKCARPRTSRAGVCPGNAERAFRGPCQEGAGGTGPRQSRAKASIRCLCESQQAYSLRPLRSRPAGRIIRRTLLATGPPSGLPHCHSPTHESPRRAPPLIVLAISPAPILTEETPCTHQESAAHIPGPGMRSLSRVQSSLSGPATSRFITIPAGPRRNLTPDTASPLLPFFRVHRFFCLTSLI